MCFVSGYVSGTTIEPRLTANISTTAIKPVFIQHGNILFPGLPVHEYHYKMYMW
jgi:hypothetical protein